MQSSYFWYNTLLFSDVTFAFIISFPFFLVWSIAVVDVMSFRLTGKAIHRGGNRAHNGTREQPRSAH